MLKQFGSDPHDSVVSAAEALLEHGTKKPFGIDAGIDESIQENAIYQLADNAKAAKKVIDYAFEKSSEIFAAINQGPNTGYSKS